VKLHSRLVDRIAERYAETYCDWIMNYRSAYSTISFEIRPTCCKVNFGIFADPNLDIVDNIWLSMYRLLLMMMIEISDVMDAAVDPNLVPSVEASVTIGHAPPTSQSVSE
jgi:hypothetical protein